MEAPQRRPMAGRVSTLFSGLLMGPFSRSHSGLGHLLIIRGAAQRRP
jgi:hypothetical protein